MPRKNKQARASKANGKNSAALQHVSEEDREALQTMPPLTMVTASTATVFRDIGRAATVRYNRKTAADGWAYVMDHFHEIPLKHEKGQYDRRFCTHNKAFERISTPSELCIPDSPILVFFIVPYFSHHARTAKS